MVFHPEYNMLCVPIKIENAKFLRSRMVLLFVNFFIRHLRIDISNMRQERYAFQAILMIV